MSKIYVDFENAFKYAEEKRIEYKLASEKLRDLAAMVVGYAASPDEPVDVNDILDQIGKGVSVEKIASDDPILDENKIKDCENEYTEEVKKNAEQIRAVVTLAAKVLAKGAMGGL